MLELHPEDSVCAVYEALGFPDTIEAVILVNGHHAAEDTPLSDGDTLTLYPTMAGG